MATKAIYNITSELNHPLFTENSPSTNAAITLKGVLNILGVLSAASLIPSMANSRIKNCKIIGIFIVALLAGLEGILDEFQFHQPIVACTLIGIVSGDPMPCIILGGTLQMIALGWAHLSNPFQSSVLKVKEQLT